MKRFLLACGGVMVLGVVATAAPGEFSVDMSFQSFFQRCRQTAAREVAAVKAEPSCKEETTETTWDRREESCTFSGYCYGYRMNLETSSQEYVYDYFSDCTGTLERDYRITIHHPCVGPSYETESEAGLNPCH